MGNAAARFVWKLARRHTWGAPIPAAELVRLVARDEDEDELRRILREDVLALSFVAQGPEGLYIPNGQEKHVAAADWLRAQTTFSDLQIRATLSRLPDDWPSNG